SVHLFREIENILIQLGFANPRSDESLGLDGVEEFVRFRLSLQQRGCAAVFECFHASRLARVRAPKSQNAQLYAPALANRIDTEFMQYRSPVGFGPSSNTCPRCASHRRHDTAVRVIPRLMSTDSMMFSFAIG